MKADPLRAFPPAFDDNMRGACRCGVLILCGNRTGTKKPGPTRAYFTHYPDIYRY